MMRDRDTQCVANGLGKDAMIPVMIADTPVCLRTEARAYPVGT